MKTAAATGTQAGIRFENILFATDFSPAAAAAIPYVREIARQDQSSVVVLHVRPPVLNAMAAPESWPADIEASMKAEDERQRDEMRGAFAGIPLKFVFGEGDLMLAVNAAVAKHHVDLLVIGTRGRTGIKKLVLGSAAEEIFRSVDCPVLTIGPHSDARPRAGGEFRKILCATDLSAESKRAAAYAASLAQEFEAELILLHVYAPSKAYTAESWSKIQESSKEALRKLLPPGVADSCRPEYRVESGEPAEQILSLANLSQADLIVLGVQAKTGIPVAATHLPIATAHKVVSQAMCPVLTIRHP